MWKGLDRFLLALTMEEGATNKGMWGVPRSCKRQWNGFLLRVSRKEQPCWHLDFSLVVLDFWQEFSSVQLLSHVRHPVTPWTAVRQASLSITNSRSLLKLMPIELVMPSNHLIFCRPLLLLPSIFPSIRVFSNESALCIRWPRYWSCSLSISPSNEHPGLISFRMD